MLNLVFVNYFLINTLDLSGNIVPFDVVYLVISATCSELSDCRILEKTINLVSHCVHIPEVYLEGILEDFGTT
jgi:hypothetical protein